MELLGHRICESSMLLNELDRFCEWCQLMETVWAVSCNSIAQSFGQLDDSKYDTKRGLKSDYVFLLASFHD